MSESADIRIATRNNLRAQVHKERAELRAMRDAQWIKFKQKGWSNVKIAKRFGVSESTVRRRTK